VADPARLRDILNSRGVSRQCPSCGNDDWAPLDTNVVLQASTGSQAELERGGAECLAIACKRCGFVRLHSAQVLEET
jgi:predicted nucleic-acid-binding Zn-ribbon protein